MKTKSLIDTNPYLKDEATRRKLVIRSVVSSSGVEGIKVDPNNLPYFEIPHRREKRIYKRSK